MMINIFIYFSAMYTHTISLFGVKIYVVFFIYLNFKRDYFQVEQIPTYIIIVFIILSVINYHIL